MTSLLRPFASALPSPTAEEARETAPAQSDLRHPHPPATRSLPKPRTPAPPLPLFFVPKYPGGSRRRGAAPSSPTGHAP